MLTAQAAMLGGLFNIGEPMFGGLAVALILGLLVSTVLTLLVTPIVYYAYHWPRTIGAPRQAGPRFRRRQDNSVQTRPDDGS